MATSIIVSPRGLFVIRKTHSRRRPMALDASRLRCSNVGLRHTLYAPTTMYIGLKWVYWMLGITAFYIIGTFLLFARRLFLCAVKIGISDRRLVASRPFD